MAIGGKCPEKPHLGRNQLLGVQLVVGVGRGGARGTPDGERRNNIGSDMVTAVKLPSPARNP